jgi:hypothetical protein
MRPTAASLAGLTLDEPHRVSFGPMLGIPRWTPTHFVVGAACVAVTMAAAVSIEAATANPAGAHNSLRRHPPSETVQATRFLRQTTRRPEEFPPAVSRVPLGPRVTHKVPNGIDPYGKFRPPAAIVTMRLPKRVRYNPIRVVHIGKPVHPDYYGSGWFRGRGWGAVAGWGLADPTAMITDEWAFAWARKEQRCDGTAVDLAGGVRVCEAFRTLDSPTGQGKIQVLQLWKHAIHGGYLYLGLEASWRGAFPTTAPAIAGAFDKPIFDEALAIVRSAHTRRHRKPLAWPPGPTHRPTKCLGFGPGGATVKLPLSDCGPEPGPAPKG